MQFIAVPNIWSLWRRHKEIVKLNIDSYTPSLSYKASIILHQFMKFNLAISHVQAKGCFGWLALASHFLYELANVSEED